MPKQDWGEALRAGWGRESHKWQKYKIIFNYGQVLANRKVCPSKDKSGLRPGLFALASTKIIQAQRPGSHEYGTQGKFLPCRAVP